MDHLFIVGVGRSGTTLVQSIFNAHSEIAFTPETHFIYNYLRPGARAKRPQNQNELLEVIKSDPNLQRLKLDWEILSGNLNYNEQILEHFLKSYLKAYAQKEQVQIIGDKDPMNSGLLPLIKNLFPEAYVIHVIRDPRDVILSRLKSDWGKKYPFIAHLGDHKVSLQKAMREGPGLFGSKYIETRYEDIIENTEVELKKICESLPVKFETSMLNFSDSADNLVSEEEKKWKGNIFGQIIRKNSGKWKSGLSTFQKNMASLLLGDLIVKLGYEKSETAPAYLFPYRLAFTAIELYFQRKYRIGN